MILYWQDIPSEVKAWDDFDQIKVSLSSRFAERIDASAQKQGHIQADAYMSHLRWSDEAEPPGMPEEVANAVKQELEAKFGGAQEWKSRLTHDSTDSQTGEIYETSQINLDRTLFNDRPTCCNRRRAN